MWECSKRGLVKVGKGSLINALPLAQWGQPVSRPAIPAEGYTHRAAATHCHPCASLSTPHMPALDCTLLRPAPPRPQATQSAHTRSLHARRRTSWAAPAAAARTRSWPTCTSRIARWRTRTQTRPRARSAAHDRAAHSSGRARRSRCERRLGVGVKAWGG